MTNSEDPITRYPAPNFGHPDYDAPDVVDDDDDDRDFTAEHVGMVVPPVGADAARHLKRLVAGWAMLADLSFSDLLLYVPLSASDAGPRQFLVANQIRPNTGQTLFTDDVVGRTWSSEQRPAVASAAATGRIIEAQVRSTEAADGVKVTAIPVSFAGEVVAVVARESAISLSRPLGELERVYLEVFDRLAAMVASGEFPFHDEEVLATGGPRVGDGSIVLGAHGAVEFISPNGISALRRLGVSGRIEGQRLADMGVETAATYRAFFSACPSAEEVERDGVCVMLRCIPLISAGRVDGALVLLHDITELRNRDRLLVSKDATIREIHHRVKNNLQTISSLLRLQGRRLTEPTAKAAIEESVRRIRSIALVHETLSREDGDDVDFGDIIGPLVRMVEEGLTSPDKPLRFSIIGDGGKLPSPAATSLSVILTELLQNVVDHAYPHETLSSDATAQVRIELGHSLSELHVSVVDDGVGLDATRDSGPGSSLGLSIVNGLVEELGGTITFGPSAAINPAVPADHQRCGTRVSLTVPVSRTPDAERPPLQGGRSVDL